MAQKCSRRVGLVGAFRRRTPCPLPPILAALARSFLAGETNVEEIVARASRMLGRPWRWLRPLAERYVAAVAGKTRPRKRDVIRFIREDAGFGRARSRHSAAMYVEQWLGEPQEMQPAPAAAGWDIPAIESIGALADWLGLDAGRPGLVCRSEGLGLPTAPSAAGPLSLPDPDETVRQHPVDRSSQAAIETGAAADSDRDSGEDSPRTRQFTVFARGGRSGRLLLRTRGIAWSSGWTCAISFPPSRACAFRRSFALWGIPKRWPICLGASARTLSRARCGSRPPRR